MTANKRAFELPVATLTIHGAGEMTDRQLDEIAEWMRAEARRLKLDGHNYSARFRARFFGR